MSALQVPDYPTPSIEDFIRAVVEAAASLIPGADCRGADGPTIDCAYQGDPVAVRVYLDSSDAKIAVKQIKLSACTIHAEWHISERN